MIFKNRHSKKGKVRLILKTFDKKSCIFFFIFFHYVESDKKKYIFLCYIKKKVTGLATFL